MKWYKGEVMNTKIAPTEKSPWMVWGWGWGGGVETCMSLDEPLCEHLNLGMSLVDHNDGKFLSTMVTLFFMGFIAL